MLVGVQHGTGVPDITGTVARVVILSVPCACTVAYYTVFTGTCVVPYPCIVAYCIVYYDTKTMNVGIKSPNPKLLVMN